MNGSGINTLLLVIVLLMLVGGGIWWYMTYGPGAPSEEGAALEVGGGSS